MVGLSETKPIIELAGDRSRWVSLHSTQPSTLNTGGNDHAGLYERFASQFNDSTS